MSKKANEVGSSINQKKTKYLEINAKRNNKNTNTHLKMGQNNFEMVQNLSSLGSAISDSNANSEESLARIKERK